MQASSKLIRPKSIILKTQAFSISRSWFSSQQQQNKNPDEEKTVKEIVSIIRGENREGGVWWLSNVISLENLPHNLTPDFIQSVFEHFQSCYCDPAILYDFFKWSSTQLARNGTSQNLISFFILFKFFCLWGTLLRAKNVIKYMVTTRKPPVSDVLDTIKSVGLSSSEFTKLLYIYKDNLLFDEGVYLLLSYENVDCIPDRGCYNSLMNHSLKNDKMDLFWKVYERLVEANVTPNISTYNYVIDAYCRSGKMEDAKRVFSEMEENCCNPDLVTYDMLFRAVRVLLRYGLVNEALDYKKSMMEKGLIIGPCIEMLFTENNLSDAQVVLDDAGLIPNDVTCNSMIDGFMREGKIEEALGSLDEMIAKNCHPLSTVWCINNMMKDLLEQNKMESFWKVYEKMLTKKVLIPDGLTYNNLIDAYVRDGKVKDAKKLFSKMVKKGYKPSLVTYNELISRLCKTGFVNTALEIKKSMKKEGLKASRCTYNNLIDGLCKLKRTQDAKLLFNEMAFVGLSPYNFTYTAMIDGSLKRGKTDEAFRLKDEMVAKGVEVNLVTYNCIIDGLCKLGQCENAIKTLNHMREEGLSPDVTCYNSLILGLCNLNRIEEARAFLAQMMENGVKPNAFTYGALISAYISIKEVKVANAYITEMIGHGIIPDRIILASMIDGHCKEGNPKESLSVLRNMVAQGILPDYNTFVQGFARNQMLELAMEVFKEFQEEGLNLDVLSYNYLISGFIEQDDLLNAFQLFNDMEQRKVLPDIVTYNTLIGGLCKTGDIRRARELFDKIPGKGVMVNACITIIDGYCQTGNLFEAFRLLDEMPVKGIQVNASVYRALVNGCCREGDSEWGLLLFDRMVKSGFESTPAFNTLIDGFSNIMHIHCKSGKIKEAEHLLMEMKRKKLTPTIEAYSSLLHSYIKSGDKSKIFTFLGDLTELGIPKNEVSDLLLDGVSEEYNFEKSLELLDELVAKELCCRSIFDRSLYFFCKKGKFFEALACIDEVKKRGVTLSSDTCETLVAGLKNHGYDDETVGKLVVKFGWAPGSASVNEYVEGIRVVR